MVKAARRPRPQNTDDALAIDEARQQLAAGLSVLAGMTIGVMHTITRLQGVPEDQQTAVIERQLLETLAVSQGQTAAQAGHPVLPAS